jgi:hypothetical protein
MRNRSRQLPLLDVEESDGADDLVGDGQQLGRRLPVHGMSVIEGAGVRWAFLLQHSVQHQHHPATSTDLKSVRQGVNHGSCDQLLIEGVCGRDKSSGVWDFRRNYTSCCWSGRRFFGGGGARVFVVATRLSARLCGQVNTKRKLRRNLENGPVDRTSVGRRAFGIR